MKSWPGGGHGKGQEVTKNIINHPLSFMIVNTKSTENLAVNLEVVGYLIFIFFNKLNVMDQSVGKRQLKLMLALNKRTEVTKNH